MSEVRQAHQKKSEIVNNIIDLIKKSNGVVIAKYTNLTVAQLTKLREKSKERNIYIKVFKDSLFRRAISELKINGLDEYLTDQNIYLFSEDGLSPIKTVAEFSKLNKDLILKAGIYEGKVLITSEVNELASLPSKDELYSMFASSLIYPLRQFMLLTKEIAKLKSE